MGKVKAYYREQQQYQAQEYTNYYGKILMILKKCNLSDLRTIYETLFENGFRSEE
tara:strand:- start:162 stop:326 length:165 start_codon:yes stop_codon:yes gene_type:complete